MKNVTQLHCITPELLIAEISKEFKNEITRFKSEFQPKEPTEFLTRLEVANLLKIDLGTVHNWSKSGKLKRYGIGNRIYFKRSDIEQAMIQL
jgi:excisionase family DNA binding protein